MVMRIGKLYLLSKERLSETFFYAGILVAFYGSMFPWFLWSIESYYMVISCMFLFCSMIVSRTMHNPVFNQHHIILPLSGYAILALYMQIVNEQNINSFIIIAFNCFIFYTLFRYERNRLAKLSTILAKSMAILLAISIPTFLMYVAGFHFPNRSVEFHDSFYTFSNFYFFIITDGALSAIFPRFQAYFLEPAHLGTVIAVLLQAQYGNWKKWYNIILFVGLAITFSLGAYVYLTCIIFLMSWSTGKKIIQKVIISIVALSAIVATSFFYNQGDNLVHNLILLRLEVDDGELAGNNRVTHDFDAEFKNFLESDDLLFGRQKDNVFGDAGYKVFVYDFGFVGLFLLIIFYVTAMFDIKEYRASISAMIIAALIFGVDAFILWFCRFIPLYCTAHTQLINKKDKT